SCTSELNAPPDGSRPTRSQMRSPSSRMASVRAKSLAMLWMEKRSCASPTENDSPSTLRTDMPKRSRGTAASGGMYSATRPCPISGPTSAAISSRIRWYCTPLRPPQLRDQQQHPEVAEDVELHVVDPLLVRLAGVGDVEAAAVDGVAAEEIHADGDDEDDQHEGDQVARRPRPEAEDQGDAAEHLEPRHDQRGDVDQAS